MRLPEQYILENLIPALERLHADALQLEHACCDKVELIAPMYRAGARNLLHYLALRQSDIRHLQHELSLLGLSRLGQAEAHTLSSIEAVLDALYAIAGQREQMRGTFSDEGLRTARLQLKRNAAILLGENSSLHPRRVMVTMPSEAATDMQLMRELLLAGMNVMRINCAHDAPEDWLAMIRNLREAERETGRECRIYADLAGPKLRTGEISPAGRLVEFKVKRDTWGKVTSPAQIWLTPSECQEMPASAIQATLPLDAILLSAVRPGDRLEVADARGAKRSLLIVEQFGNSWLAHCFNHGYIAEGATCSLYRKDRLLAQGAVTGLPEVLQPILLRVGDELLLTRDGAPGRPARYDDNGKLVEPACIPCTLDAVFDAALPGQPVWLDDGKIGGHVISGNGRVVVVHITHAAPAGSKLQSGKGINLPETELDIPALTEADRANLKVLAGHIDMVGLSFVRDAEDVLALHRLLHELEVRDLGTVLKIETRQSFENLPAILLASLQNTPVGIMVARGDLAVEVGFERLAEVQEQILYLCEAAHVPVIWATQVLESMAKHGIPSRAEVSDAALSVRAECVMLNKGPYIVETVRFLNGVLKRMGRHQEKHKPMMRHLPVSHLAG